MLITAQSLGQRMLPGYYPSATSSAPSFASVLDGLSTALPTGYATEDNGLGTYAILDGAGQSVGTGYKSAQDTLHQYFANQAYDNLKSFSPWSPSEEPVFDGDNARIDPQTWNAPGYRDATTEGLSDEQLRARANTAADIATQRAVQMGGQRANEILGMALTGGFKAGDAGYYAPGDDRQALAALRDIGLAGTAEKDSVFGRLEKGSGEDELIAGTNALYGSKPVFDQAGKLAGYSISDVSPYSMTHNGKSNQWASSLGRDYQGADWWKQNATAMADGSFFVPLDKVADIPGWKNADNWQYHDTNIGSGQMAGGLLGSFFGPIGTAVGAAIGGFIDGRDPNDIVKGAALAGAKAWAGAAARQFGGGAAGGEGVSAVSAGGGMGEALGNGISAPAANTGGQAAGMGGSLGNGVSGSVATNASGSFADALSNRIASGFARTAVKTGIAAATGGNVGAAAKSGLLGTLGSAAGLGVGDAVGDATDSGFWGKLADGTTSRLVGGFGNALLSGQLSTSGQAASGAASSGNAAATGGASGPKITNQNLTLPSWATLLRI